MVIFAFLGVAYCQREGGHVRMELLVRNFRKRLLWLVEVIGLAIGLFIIGILIFTSFDHFLRAYEIGDSTINADLPVWPAAGQANYSYCLYLVMVSFVAPFRWLFSPFC